MKTMIVTLIVLLGLNACASTPDKRTSLCFILATEYDNLVVNTSGGMDTLFFLSQEPKKATQTDIQNVIKKDTEFMGSVQWTLSRLSNGSLHFKDANIQELLKKNFAKSLAMPNAYSESKNHLKNKLTLEQAQDFRKVRNSFTTNFLDEYRELCTKDNFVSTAI